MNQSIVGARSIVALATLKNDQSNFFPPFARLVREPHFYCNAMALRWRRNGFGWTARERPKCLGLLDSSRRRIHLVAVSVSTITWNNCIACRHIYWCLILFWLDLYLACFVHVASLVVAMCRRQSHTCIIDPLSKRHAELYGKSIQFRKSCRTCRTRYLQLAWTRI